MLIFFIFLYLRAFKISCSVALSMIFIASGPQMLFPTETVAVKTSECIVKPKIHILGIFTEKPFSKPLDRKVVYIPSLSHATSHDVTKAF